MSERFMVDDAGTLIDLETRDTYDYVSDVLGLLNMLHEENMLLKGEVAHYKLILMSLKKEVDRICQIPKAKGDTMTEKRFTMDWHKCKFQSVHFD